MSHKASYHAISKPDITSFNKELKQFVDSGYSPVGSIAVSVCYNDNDRHQEHVEVYAILLMKMIEIGG